MQELIPGWTTHIERGPEWLFVRLEAADIVDWTATGLAESLWRLLQQQFTYRLVLEMEHVRCLHSSLVGELVRLHKRVLLNGGLMRLCGLSDANQEVLRTTRLADRFPQFRDRHEALMGFRPTQPR